MGSGLYGGLAVYQCGAGDIPTANAGTYSDATVTVDDKNVTVTTGTEDVEYINGNGGTELNDGSSISGFTTTVNSGNVCFADGGHSMTEGASVTGNSLVFNDGTGFTLFGGILEANSGKVNSNNVTMNGGTTDYIYGGYLNMTEENNSVTADGNSVNITGGTVNNNVYGGYGIHGTANNNTISVDGDSTLISGHIIGGDGNKEASGNTVNFYSGTVGSGNSDSYIIGGFSESGKASSNTVNVNSHVKGSTDDDSIGVVGGWSEGDDANNNCVNVKNGEVAGGIEGGVSLNGNANSNTVDISDGEVSGFILGGQTAGSGVANSNKIILSNTNTENSNVTSLIYGGCSSSEASYNYIELDNVEATYNLNMFLHGGFGTISDRNTVQIMNSTLGGRFLSFIAGRGDDSSDYNTLSMTDCTIGFCLDAKIKGGLINGDGESYGNTVNLDGITFNLQLADVAAGECQDGNGKTTGNILNLSDISTANNSYLVLRAAHSTGASTSNTLNISGTNKFSGIVLGGLSGNDAAINNTVNISGNNTIQANLLAGGYSDNGTGAVSGNTINASGNNTITGNIYGGYNVNGTGTVTGNTVNISESNTVTGTLSGGYSPSGNSEVSDNTVNVSGTSSFTNLYGGYTSNSAATNNTVNLMNATTVTGNLYGGYSTTSSLNNSLYVREAGTTVGGDLNYFQNLYFYVPKTVQNGDTLMTVTGTADVTGSTVGVAWTDNSTSLVKGDSINLITAGTLNADATYTNSTTAMQGVSLLYDLDIAKDNNNLVASIKDVNFNEDTDIIPEPRLAATSMLNWNILDDIEIKTQKSDFEIIAAIDGSNLRAETGSYADVKSRGLLVGAARTLKKSYGTLTYGPFVEYAKGNYSAYLDNGTVGRGDTHFLGLGFFGQKNLHSGMYYEGSMRAGGISTDYHGAISNKETSYKIDNSYFALHLGAGKKFSVDNKNNFDLYGKFYYTYQAGTDAELSTGDYYSFDCVKSLRLRLGGRYNYNMNENNRLYAGLAYEYEFNGDAHAYYQDYATATPSLRGGSGMLELGWDGEVSKAMTVGIRLNGWAGKKRGVTGTLHLNWGF